MMNPDPLESNSGVVAPFECLKEGWALIKDQYWLFLGLALVTILIGQAVPIVLIGPMMCGLYLCLFGKMRGAPVEFGDLFKGFDYFVPGLVAAAIQTVPMFIVLVPSYLIFFAFAIATLPHDRYARDQGPPAVFFVGLMLFVLVIVVMALVIHVLFLFAYPLIVDRKLSGWDAIKTSYRAALKNFGGILGLVLLNAGLGILGVLACYVGVFFVLPITFAAYAAAYRRVFPEIELRSMAPPPPPASWA
ncbi:MAG TPA: hypothetical protein VHE60_18480 [Pyrinomonadaceae bacterium]|nr:hypothetical protein [Pyrinomonadaceae bacterium]